MNEPIYDITVIGGGIIGLAVARAFLDRKNLSIAVLEAEDRLAAHQTGNNSGVIHSGLYYKPGSLKAVNCTKGREMLYQFCAEHGISHERCGKLVVATHEGEIPALEELHRRGTENGLQGLHKLSGEELHDYEPHITGVAGLWVPDTGIVDFVRVVEVLAQQVKECGGAIHTNHRLMKVERENGTFILETSKNPVRCRNVVNCAGLQCDRVARMFGVNPGLKIIPFRGEYYELKEGKHHLVRNLIYPVPDPRFPFLGVHFTRMIQGGIEAGPNAVLAFKREGYTKTSFSLRDCAETCTYPGFWKMAARFWKTGVGEFYRSFSKSAFVRALQKLMPELTLDDIIPAGAGVRAQAVEPTGKLVDDFRIVEAERMIHVLNAPSPAATASLNIGETVAERALGNFGV